MLLFEQKKELIKKKLSGIYPDNLNNLFCKYLTNILEVKLKENRELKRILIQFKEKYFTIIQSKLAQLVVKLSKKVHETYNKKLSKLFFKYLPKNMFSKLLEDLINDKRSIPVNTSYDIIKNMFDNIQDVYFVKNIINGNISTSLKSYIIFSTKYKDEIIFIYLSYTINRNSCGINRIVLADDKMILLNKEKVTNKLFKCYSNFKKRVHQNKKSLNENVTKRIDAPLEHIPMYKVFTD